MVHKLFLKCDLIEFMLHEAKLIDENLLHVVTMFRTPLTVLKRFSASGEAGLVDNFRQPDAASGRARRGRQGSSVKPQFPAGICESHKLT